METVWRVAATYLFLMVVLRVMGKRDVGQLAPFDLVVLLLIPELFAGSMMGEDSSITSSIIGVSTLLSLVFLTSVFVHVSEKAGAVIEGRPTVLVRHGSLVEENLNRERVGPDEILAQMHLSGLERMEQVKWGILEADGRISFSPWEQEEGVERPEESDVV